MDSGYTDTVTHAINFNEENPIKLPHRRIPPNVYSEVRELIQTILNAGHIRPKDHQRVPDPFLFYSRGKKTIVLGFTMFFPDSLEGISIYFLATLNLKLYQSALLKLHFDVIKNAALLL